MTTTRENLLDPAHLSTLVALHRRASADVDALLTGLSPATLTKPTPCAGWTVADLLAHMVGQNRGFAAALRDGTAPAAAFAPVPYTRAEWDASATALSAAFGDAAPSDTAVLIELAPAPLPAAFVVAAQLLDTAVHGWDLARGLGTDHTPAAEIVAAVAQVASVIPDDESRLATGAAFGPAVTAAQADDTARPGDTWPAVLARLGRDPR